MKINFVLLSTAKNGGTRVIFEMANHLVEKKHEVIITSLDQPQHYWFPLKKEIKINYPENKYFIPFPGRAKVPFFAVFRKIFKAMKLPYDVDRIKLLAQSIPETDINIATEFPTAQAVFLSGKGKMFYYIQHDETTFSKNPIESRLALSSYYLPLKHLVVAHWLKDLVKSRTGKEAVYLGNGVNTEVFKPLNNKEKNTVMGFIRGIEWKGEKDMLKAFSILQEKNKDICFKIVDPKNLLKKLLKELNIKLNKIEILKKHTDEELSSFYSSSDVFVFPSHLEGFGLPPLEAMACRTSVVTTECLGIKDFVVNNFNALVVPFKNPEKMAEAVLKILKSTELSNKLIENGFQTAKEFNWHQVVDRLEIALKNEAK